MSSRGHAKPIAAPRILATLRLVRWDSPLVLAIAGTLSIHLIVVTAGDAMVVTHPPSTRVPAPHIDLVDIESPPVLTPPPPPPPSPQPPAPVPVPVNDVKPAPRPPVARATPQIRAAPSPEPQARTSVPVPSGGDEVVHMDDIAPAATGVGVAVGKRSTGHIGRGGTGGGTGAGSGSGSADEVKPVSVATIKVRALPRGDYAYVGVGKDYPAEAKALGIEGAIRVRLVVDEQGKVTSRVLLNKLGHGLDELALQRAAEIQFEPAKDTDDKPVTSVVVWTFNMTLPK
jgi:protein TonB